MENIVLDEQGHVQLVDFGFSKWLGQGDRTMTICGTLQYMAPEIAAGRAYDRAVDWWSMGVLLHVLLTSRFPFPFAQVTHHLELR
jgi:serine/threonine protein kinase